MLCIYVEEGFDNEAPTHTALVPVAKRAVKEANPKDAHKDRQVSFLNRESPNVSVSSWHPQKVHRGHAKNWCRTLDSQFQISSSLSGLDFFVRKPNDSLWADCFNEPPAAIAQDLGSEGNTGFHALEREFKLNTEQWNDQNHANNCDWNGMMGSMGMVGAQLLNIVGWNIPFGPRAGERLRQHQMRSCLTKLYDNHTSPTVPLFGRHARGILESLNKMNVQLPGVRDPEEEVWDYMKERAKLQPVTSRRTHMSRFSSAPYSLIKHADAWDICEFETTYCCLEMDFLGSSKITKLLKGNLGIAGAGDDGAAVAPVSDTSLDEKLIRASAVNAVVIGYQMYSNGTNRRNFTALAEPARVMVDFHTEQNRDTRGSNSTHEWVVKQVGHGGYVEHVSKIIGVLHDPVALCRADYAISDSDVDALGDDVISEDLFADFLAQSVHHLAGWRQRRNLGFCMGWPKRLVGLLTDRAPAIIKQFMVDRDDFIYLTGIANKSKELVNVLGRDLFEKEVVKQHVRCAEKVGWRPDDLHRAVVKVQTSGLLQTQLIEDMIGSQKNNKSTQAVNKYKRPMLSMANALQAEIMDNRHNFSSISADMPLAKKTAA